MLSELKNLHSAFEAFDLSENDDTNKNVIRVSRRLYKLAMEDQKLHLSPDVFTKKLPEIAVTVEYTHPILNHVENGDFWCGAHPDEDVYNNPFTARKQKWEVSYEVWQSFQSRMEHATSKELEDLQYERDLHIWHLEETYGVKKRPRFGHEVLRNLESSNNDGE